MASTTSILLQNGTLLIHNDQDHVRPVKADLLVIGNAITEIGPSISSPSSNTTVIDCTGKIIAPGFVDTHHHVGQTQLKGRHANDLLLDYMPKDIFWGELGGCMEAIDAGTTMVVDHAHMNHSAEHCKFKATDVDLLRLTVEHPASSAISATVFSGIRSYFCYCPTGRIASWSPFEMAGSLMPDWVQSQLVDLAAKQPFGNGRVRLGFAFDGFFLPKEMVVGLYEQVRGLSIKLITSHYVRNAIMGNNLLVALLSSYGLLKDDILFSHANGALPEDAVRLTAANAHISSMPDTELQMASGASVCFRPDMYKVSSLGIDCHSNNSGDILSQMRLALQNARGAHNQAFVEVGKIGSIAVGKLADLVIAEGPSMVCSAAHDPVAAIVLHASLDVLQRSRGEKKVTVAVDARTQTSKYDRIQK
ncbi:hypothetical protein DFH09DRAFT_1386467 [Mycena vulgaris]|nr:hypothetical protein DFH09DRAFT_1386467 [Mycena vulgaris]